MNINELFGLPDNYDRQVEISGSFRRQVQQKDKQISKVIRKQRRHLGKYTYWFLEKKINELLKERDELLKRGPDWSKLGNNITDNKSSDY